MKVLYLAILVTAVVAQPFPEDYDSSENDLRERLSIERFKFRREASPEADPEADPVGKEEPKGKFFGLSRPITTSSTSLSHTSVSKPGHGSGFNSGHSGFNRPAFNRPGFNRPGFNSPGLNTGFGQPLGYQPGSGYKGANVAFSNIGPNGRPALNYQAPGMSVDIRKKQKQ
ncbi:uncharacterized protein LOC136026857 [Artemia franciscana]|uniref:uncharacterized protein LOC136026857 n=1 Tax=Artemia franciscana TaxID=6661 RepID=UPI0032DA2946